MSSLAQCTSPIEHKRNDKLQARSGVGLDTLLPYHNRGKLSRRLGHKCVLVVMSSKSFLFTTHPCCLVAFLLCCIIICFFFLSRDVFFLSASLSVIVMSCVNDVGSPPTLMSFCFIIITHHIDSTSTNRRLWGVTRCESRVLIDVQQTLLQVRQQNN